MNKRKAFRDLGPIRENVLLHQRKYQSLIKIRRLVQYSTLVIFFILFIAAANLIWAGSVVNLFIRIDPLLMIANLLANREFLLASLPAIFIIIITFIFGRAWCGWVCPLGTILDSFQFNKSDQKRSPKNPQVKYPDSLRGIKYALLLLILFSAVFGNLSLLIFDPLTLLIRTLTTSIWPILDQLISSLEKSLYRIELLSETISEFDRIIRPLIFPIQPQFYRSTFFLSAIFLGILFLNALSARFWCRYLCPLGALLGLFSKFTLFRRQVAPDCKGCHLCETSCPTGTIHPEQNYSSDPSECTMCLECLETCPRSAITIHPGLKPAKWREYDPSRRQAITYLGISLVGLAIMRRESDHNHPHAHWLLPPGVSRDNFLQKCVRCTQCIRACPTSALQPAITEAGLEGFWAPILVPRLGYCDYSCNICGRICPVEAIPALVLESKRHQIIGKAYIDQNRCIAWADHQDCIVCEEMCPTPNKAIYLESSMIDGGDGLTREILLPKVNRDRCIGCGICEYKCPVIGDAAIRVYTS